MLAAGLLPKAGAQPWKDSAFAAQDVEKAYRALGAAKPRLSNAVTVEAPEVAENGAVVPFNLASSIAATRAIALLVERNPTPLIARFAFAPGTRTQISLRAKMAETSMVYVLAETESGWFYAERKVEVIRGGCDG